MLTTEIRGRVSKAKKAVVTEWGEGVFLEATSGQPIQQLLQRATADRLKLAADFRRRGRRLLSAGPPLYRDAVSRFYYSIYHAARAVVFFSYGGDDNQDHRVLPGALPADFEDSALWANRIKTARDNRNRADYDPFPKSANYWLELADVLNDQSTEFLVLARQYLVAKGCGYI